MSCVERSAITYFCTVVIVPNNLTTGRPNSFDNVHIYLIFIYTQTYNIKHIIKMLTGVIIIYY